MLRWGAGGRGLTLHHGYDQQSALLLGALVVAEGNPGAAVVISQPTRCFPSAANAALVNFVTEHGPTGSELWLRFKDVCGEDIQTLALDLWACATEWRGEVSF
jgi:hypothetical protein